ncbi:MAG: DUF2752 domain-containing protein [Muribaculaceae bacterium]|nr:DUF2752 domain-containing protein [Muribaculaceae bacterium]
MATVIVVVFYIFVNPATSRWVPHCVFHTLTGYECPGCGLQRAVYATLHGDLAAAWNYNPFLFFIAPVGAGYLAVELSGSELSRLRRFMFSPIALWSLVAVTLVWWVVRNIA